MGMYGKAQPQRAFPKSLLADNPYAERNALLRELGHESYPEYLKSKTWKYVRAKALERDKFRCVACGKRATQVHHKAYTKSVLKGRSIRQLASLCRECHKWIEFELDNTKRPLRIVWYALQDRKRMFRKRPLTA